MASRKVNILAAPPPAEGSTGGRRATGSSTRRGRRCRRGRSRARG
ncbi:unnamed protein product [Spirodela intermedia]|uniref:Uncharacterized protein n=1 Tax=Spirodela intermedia TaxID=51605 RepID=A0A7I8ITN9_SPIIN|nr:unnamed protein product [Spirodela intermedia]CAA6661333.1 unnamed protein product [Spirodela intermedia]